MDTSRDETRSLLGPTLIGTGLQLVMVLAGHYSPGVAQFFAPGGMAISAIAGALEGVCKTETAASMEAAVAAAHRLAAAGDTVLLSPACASFDMFRDYGHRGDVFAAAVLKLEAPSP